MKKVPAHTLVNVFADRKCTFFPHPMLYLWASCETILTGTAVRYTTLPPPKNDPRCLQDKTSLACPQNQAPLIPRNLANSEIYRLLVDVDPQRATIYLDSLTLPERQAITDYIVTVKGTSSIWNWKFRIAENLDKREKDFINWYLPRYSDFRVTTE